MRGLGHSWKRGAAALLLGLLVLGGCRQGETGEVRAIVIGERLPRLVDPASRPLTGPELLLVGNSAQGLVRFDNAGNIVPGLAERWAVSDDGLSYVFRLKNGSWPDGRRIRGRDVVRLLNRHLERGSRNPLRDTVGAISQVVAMTDRVVAIELSAPRPHLLQLLAQPEFGLVREGQGSGPLAATREEDSILLTRTIAGVEEEGETRERVVLDVASAEEALAAFRAGEAELVLGGTSGDLAVALGARLPRGVLRIDPVAGLFGLVPARSDGPAGRREVRALLDEAIDRQALVGALGLPQLQPRTSILQPGLDGVAAPAQPRWAGEPAEDRRSRLVARAAELFDPAPGTAAAGEGNARPVIRVALPAGPGGQIILRRLATDWGVLGLDVRAAGPRERADFRWLDEVAPSSSPAWFLRRFRCAVVPVCLEEVDQLLDAARLAGFAPQRNAFFADAERQMREEVLFIPVAAPIRWSVVGREITGFAENRFARHPLTGLRGPANARD